MICLFWHVSCKAIDVMNLRNPHIKNGFTKTLLIILGVIIALIMTINSPMFSAENIISEDELNQPSMAEAHQNNENTSSGGVNYNSGTRLLHIFTKNLPYLNHK